MGKFKLPCIISFWIFCSVEGQTFTISTEFIDGKLIFRWPNITTNTNYIMVYKDGQSSNWTKTRDDEYIVKNVSKYTTVKINVLEDYQDGRRNYTKTYAHNVNTVQSTEGKSKNISWTAEYFPRSGDYKIFHAYIGRPQIIMTVTNTTYKTDFKMKYLYHAKPGSANVLFEVRNISVEDAGYYVGSGSESKAFLSAKGVVLVVSGKPEKPKITGDLEIKEGRNATLKCESKSTSAPDYHKFPALSYTWFVNGTRISGEQSVNYKFKVYRNDSYKGYSCQAKETLESERSDEIKINILYGPRSVRISSKSLQDIITIRVGAPLGPYNCSADCNPPCTVQWKYKRPEGDMKNVTPYGNSPLPLPDLNADRTKMTLIRCVANNSEGRKIDGIKLNILYLSKPVIFLNNSNQTLSSITEGHTLNISCFVEGNPTPTIKLSRVLKGHINEQQEKYWLNYTIAKAQCSDTGTYRCTGNTSFESKHEELTVNVTCEPRLDTSLSVSFKTTYGSKSGPNVKVVVTVPVLANPFPSSVYSRISWQGPGGNYLNIRNTVLQRDNVVYKYWINSTIPVADQNSFGNYSLIYNEQSIVNITINPEDSPKPPLNFTWISDARGYVNLSWISNFNGGPEQFFILSQMKESGWASIENLTDSGEGNLRYHDLGPLTPGLEYLYQLESCNRINCSLSPREVKVIVKAPPISSSSLFGDNTMLILVGASAAGFLLVVVLTLAVTMYCKTTKKSATKKRNRQEGLSGSTVQDDTPADVVVYAAVDKSVLMKNRQQDDVVKSDVIKDQNDDNETVYSEVIKHPKKQQTDEKKEKKKNEEKELKENNEEAGTSTRNDNSRSTNQDGLVYIDVEFARKLPSSDTKGRPVIHGEEEKTEYTFVDFTQKAPPVQESQENVK
ncbi:hemicentin-1-like [Saccostrea cucullata]|uniref:hemicentin-1-like n=1 Tax=Saccostrea cuccullata TaxID=36930 RepID=UPI002ED438F6